MATYRQWLLAQLRQIDKIDADPLPEMCQLDGLRSIINEAERRATMAGVPAAVQACKVRKGPFSIIAARKVLAACLGAIPEDPRAPMTVRQAAKTLDISERLVRDLIARRTLPHHRVGNGRGQIRILPRDIEDFRNRERPTFRHV